MLLKKNVILLFAFCLLCIYTKAQNLLSEKRELTVGDTLPNIAISNIFSRNFEEINPSDLYKNGLLIIDFWATWCTPCIEQLIKMDQLKDQYPNKFKSISVTYQDSSQVKEFLSHANNSDIKATNTLISTNDTLLSKYFPHRTIPHNVWVDSTGVIRYITGHEALNTENISRFLSERPMGIDNQKSDNMSFDSRERFDLGNDIFEYRSIFSPYIEGINGGMNLQKEPNGLNSRFFCWNGPLIRLYWVAYSLTRDGGYDAVYRPNLVEIHTMDSIKYFGPVRENAHLLWGSRYKDYDSWKKDNIFCYELTLRQPVSDSVLSRYLFQDLDRFFDVHCSIETRKIPTIVVRRDTANTKRLSPTRFPNDVGSLFTKGHRLEAKNLTLSEYFQILYRKFPSSRQPFIIDGNVDTDFRFDLSLDLSEEIEAVGGIGLTAVLEKLEDYGFSFTEEMRAYPILVLKD